MERFETYIKKAEGKSQEEVKVLIKELYAQIRKEGNEILLAKAAAATGTYCASGKYEENEEEKKYSKKYQDLYAAYKATMNEMEKPFKKEATRPQRKGPAVISATQVYDDDSRPTEHKIFL
jgi:hypothetical protein